jgi:UDP-N-acetylmuramoylalanine-D-glutamate ligase
MDDNPTSEADTVVTTVSSIEIVGMVTAATLEFDKFFGATALTNGVKIEIKLRSFTILQVTIKSLADLIKYFDTVTFTTDTKATTPNTLVRAVKKLDVMVNLLDSAKDAILVTVSDNNTGISTAAFIQCIIRGYGYVPR